MILSHLYTFFIQCDKQSWAGDNTAATTWPCFQATQFYVIAKLLYVLWLLHPDTETKILYKLFPVSEALLRCCIVTLSLSRS